MHPSQVLLAIVMATKEGACVSACAGGGGVTMAKQESSWGRVCDCIVKQHSKGEGLNFHSTQVQCTAIYLPKTKQLSVYVYLHGANQVSIVI